MTTMTPLTSTLQHVCACATPSICVHLTCACASVAGLVHASDRGTNVPTFSSSPWGHT